MPDMALIEKIRYGNATEEDNRMMLSSSYLDKILPDVYRLHTPPGNCSEATRQELNLLIRYHAAVQEGSRKAVFDSSLVPYIQQLFINNGADEKDVVPLSNSVANDVMPLVTKLKFRHNRPRPYQLAYYYGLKFFPHFSYFTSSPSFPSGHTTLAAVLCEVLGNKYPESYRVMLDFVREVRESRLYLGVHYPSDNDTAMKLSQMILENPEFMKKYGL